MYVEWSWDLRAVEARSRLASVVADGAVEDVPRAVFERLMTGRSFDCIYTSILNRLDPTFRHLLEEALLARGSLLVDRDGQEVGVINAVFVDRETARPQWLAVSHDSDGRERLVGLPVSALVSVGVEAAYGSVPLDCVREAPLLDVEFVSTHNEQELCEYYGLPPTRGAHEGRFERRATCSQAFLGTAPGEPIRWLPGPRQMTDHRRAVHASTIPSAVRSRSHRET
jgi:hypothetical protein